MGDYHNQYLKKDVLLSADVFEKFITTCLEYHGLDPCHYFRSPGLNFFRSPGWGAMLKMAAVKLEKISDIDKYLFIEKSLGGGISYIVKRYEKVNDKYMNDYDPKKPSIFITYLDMNNLYGWAMGEYLPYGGFKWLKNVDEFVVKSISEKNTIGHFLEVDPDYPDKLHELHNDYPLSPEKRVVSSDMLSNYCKKIADKYEINLVMQKK